MRKKFPAGLLAAPLAWLGVAYLGALATIFVTAFFTTDSFTGAVVRDVSLQNYREVLTPTYLGIIGRTILIAALVTVLCILIAVPFAWFMARVVPARLSCSSPSGRPTSSRPTRGGPCSSPAASWSRPSAPARVTA